MTVTKIQKQNRLFITGCKTALTETEIKNISKSKGIKKYILTEYKVFSKKSQTLKFNHFDYSLEY